MRFMDYRHLVGKNPGTYTAQKNSATALSTTSSPMAVPPSYSFRTVNEVRAMATINHSIVFKENWVRDIGYCGLD